ncbi:unnamed protein product [Larinioides sclopetarius]|uniref:E3 ubiquitin-protein ligase MARCH8 n=1 Tax=Larinioides sclopetarius TaxID=280406 RepID=A0AAV1Z456_9ARAC
MTFIYLFFDSPKPSVPGPRRVPAWIAVTPLSRRRCRARWAASTSAESATARGTQSCPSFHLASALDPCATCTNPAYSSGSRARIRAAANSASSSSSCTPRSNLLGSSNHDSFYLPRIIRTLDVLLLLRPIRFKVLQKKWDLGAWEKLEMSPVEQRKVLCSITFHVVAITCVVWSLYVLIDRTAEEMRTGVLEWPFWTKLIVVAIGFTGGLVFMYVQCKMYVQLFKRWRAFNRIIYVQNAPEKCSQQQQAVFSAAELTANVLAKSEEKRFSPDEEEFHSCRTSNSSGSTESVHQGSNHEEANSPGGGGRRQDSSVLPTAANVETGSTKTTLTSVTDSAPANDDHPLAGGHPLSEVVVVSNVEDDIPLPPTPLVVRDMTPCTGDEASLRDAFLSRQLQQTAS